MYKDVLIQGDSLEILPKLPDNIFHSCVTDPPYGIGFMKDWDKTGIAFDVDFWREVYRVMRPGAYLVSFASPRSYHRLGCAIEEAGFFIKHQLMWLYGSTFPKGLNVGKSLQRTLGKDHPVTKKFDGYKTQIRNLHEPIVLAMKPIDQKTITANTITWETGAMNIEKCKYGDRTPPSVLIDQNVAVSMGGKSAYYPQFDTEAWMYCPKPTIEQKDEGLSDLPKEMWMQDTDPAGCDLSKGKLRAGFTSLRMNSHPTVKPVPVIKWLVELITPRFGFVLDPFGGSGTTAQACIESGRVFCVVEKEEKNYNIAAQKIDWWNNKFPVFEMYD